MEVRVINVEDATMYALNALGKKRGSVDLFEKYVGSCAGTWKIDDIKRIFQEGNTTHIIELYDPVDKQLKAFAFLHAPNPRTSDHAKCVLACAGVKLSDGTSGMPIVQSKREEIARELGYKVLDLSAGNRDLATKVWGAKYGFTELPGQETKMKDIKMEKSLIYGGRRKTRKRITRKKRTRRNVA